MAAWRRNMLLMGALAALAGCSPAPDEPKRPPPLVRVEPARLTPQAGSIEAVGTARANEQVTLSAPVTDRIVELGFTDSSFVRRGQMVATLSAGRENAQLAEAEARATESGQQLHRVAMLHERGFATRHSLDSQNAIATQARAEVSGAREVIRDRVVTAPYSGWLSLRTVSRGAMIRAGDEIATLSDISVIKLDFAVPETLLSAVRPGLRIHAEAGAYPGHPFQGSVASIDPVVDSDTRTVMLRAIIPNPDRKLKPGMLLTVRIAMPARTILSIPDLAIVGEGARTFVYVIRNGMTADRVEVRTGVRSNGRTEILAGLRPGERVVTEGVVKLKQGGKVRLAAAGPRGTGASGK
jgi:membrane fusion protein (multidrug efflux system)